MLNNKQILITGGTGSFERAFVRYVFEHYPDVKRVVIFSRDELLKHCRKVGLDYRGFEVLNKKFKEALVSLTSK